jgi:hypothetical protein
MSRSRLLALGKELIIRLNDSGATFEIHGFSSNIVLPTSLTCMT